MVLNSTVPGPTASRLRSISRRLMGNIDDHAGSSSAKKEAPTPLLSSTANLVSQSLLDAYRRLAQNGFGTSASAIGYGPNVADPTFSPSPLTPSSQMPFAFGPSSLEFEDAVDLSCTTESRPMGALPASPYAAPLATSTTTSVCEADFKIPIAGVTETATTVETTEPRAAGEVADQPTPISSPPSSCTSARRRLTWADEQGKSLYRCVAFMKDDEPWRCANGRCGGGLLRLGMFIFMTRGLSVAWFFGVARLCAWLSLFYACLCK